MNLKEYVKNQDKINFVKGVTKRKVIGTHLPKSMGAKILSRGIDISPSTILKAMYGEFTNRTVNKMIAYSWFTRDEYNKAGRDSGRRADDQARVDTHKNDQNVQQAREKGQWSRGYDQGRADGFTAGKVAGKEAAKKAVNGAVQAAYDKGFKEGANAGYQRGLNQGRAEMRPRSAPTDVAGIPIDRLRKLLAMNPNNASTLGEMGAARKAVGKTLQRWIKEQFGQSVEVDVK